MFDGTQRPFQAGTIWGLGEPSSHDEHTIHTAKSDPLEAPPSSFRSTLGEDCNGPTKGLRMTGFPFLGLPRRLFQQPITSHHRPSARISRYIEYRRKFLMTHRDVQSAPRLAIIADDWHSAWKWLCCWPGHDWRVGAASREGTIL